MNSKKGVGKRAVLGLILIGIVIISVSFVSASLKDWFGFGDDSDLEGELPTSAGASAKVQVSPPATPPEIIFVSTLGNDVDLNLAASTPITFNFLATQQGFSSDLPDTNLLTTPYIIANFSNPTVGEQVRLPTICNYINSVTCTYKSIPGKACNNYSCTVSAQFYDINSTNWTIKVMMSSKTTPAVFGDYNTTQFNYRATYGISMTLNYTNWTSISLTARDTEASNVIPVTNIANTNIVQGTGHYLRINATRLYGNLGDEISSGNFTGKGGASGYCSPTYPAAGA